MCKYSIKKFDGVSRFVERKKDCGEVAETLSVFRNEYKYVINKCDVLSMQKKFDRFLTRDRNSVQNSYMVRSLYFDSINNIDYKEKLAGTEIRKKIRIRIYSPDAQQCKLEVKQKNGDLQHKVSMWITREDAGKLTTCNYSVLTKYFADVPDAVYIYSLMVRGCYRPVTLVEYDRTAYTYPLFNTRITFDANIRCNEGKMDLFAQTPVYHVLTTDQTVLEVKYNRKLVKFISDILKQYGLTKCAVSKYCMGRKVFCDFAY